MAVATLGATCPLKGSGAAGSTIYGTGFCLPTVSILIFGYTYSVESYRHL